MPGASDTSSNNIIVDLADMKTTNNPNAQLSTYRLGSCIAVAIYDAEAGVGGLLQFMLPDSAINRPKALLNPFHFADTGIPQLFLRAYSLGAVKERITCRLAGGADVLEAGNIFRIGQRNHLAARQVLSKNNVPIQGEHAGGGAGMTLTLIMKTGRVVVTMSNGEEVVI